SVSVVGSVACPTAVEVCGGEGRAVTADRGVGDLLGPVRDVRGADFRAGRVAAVALFTAPEGEGAHSRGVGTSRLRGPTGCEEVPDALDVLRVERRGARRGDVESCTHGISLDVLGPATR